MEIEKTVDSMRKDEISTTYIQKSTPDGLRSEISKTMKTSSSSLELWEL